MYVCIYYTYRFPTEWGAKELYFEFPTHPLVEHAPGFNMFIYHCRGVATIDGAKEQLKSCSYCS